MRDEDTRPDEPEVAGDADPALPQPLDALAMGRQMMDHLMSRPPVEAHELCRAMIGSATAFLRQHFGSQHALAVGHDLVLMAGAADPVAVPEATERPAGAVLH